MNMHIEAGERVTVQWRGCRVVRIDRVADTPIALLQCGATRVPVNLAEPTVSVTRVAAAQWPPLNGDVWEDHGGVEWFCRLVYDDDGDVWGAELVCAAEGKAYRQDAEEANERFGPMRLVRRRGWSPPGEALPAEAPHRVVRERMWALVAAAIGDAGLPSPLVVSLEDELVLSFAEGYHSAVDEWAEYLDAPVPQLVGQGSNVEPWRSYRSTGARWHGWDVRVWCSIQSQPDVPAGEEPAGIDDPALADRLRAARVQEARAELAGLTGMPQEQADWDGDVEDVTGPALTDADATGELAQVKNAHQDLATTAAYAAGRATLQEWLGPDAEPEESGPVWDGPGPIGDHDA